MKRIRRITAEEENFRAEPMSMPGAMVIKRDPVEPVPVGTIVLEIFRVVGYDPDCDGSLMARMESIDLQGDETGWQVDSIGLYPSTTLVTTLDELHSLVGEEE